MTYRLIISPTAKADTHRAFRWINERSAATAARWSAGLIKSILTLKDNPELHPVSEEASEQFGFEVREMLYKRRRQVYRILFSVDGAVVNVLAIRHSAQGPIEP